MYTKNPWGASPWSEVSGVDRLFANSRIAINGDGLYAKTTSLRAISGRELEKMRPKPTQGEGAEDPNWYDAFAMRYFHIESIELPGDERPATAMFSYWTREPGTVMCAVYTVKDGVPQWAFSQILWYDTWFDGEVDLVRSGPRRQLAGVVAFQPPLELALYRWRDGRLVPGCPGWSVVWRMPLVVVRSYHRWLEALSPLLLLTLVVWVVSGRRKRKRVEAPATS